LSSQGALPSWSDLKELLHTISASASVLWAGVGFIGRISYSLTLKPDCAICQAASEPAKPPPATKMGFRFISADCTPVCSGVPGELGSADRFCRVWSAAATLGARASRPQTWPHATFVVKHASASAPPGVAHHPPSGRA